MKIGIDVRPLQAETQYRGIGKALGFALHYLSLYLKPEDEVVFYIDGALSTPENINDYPSSKVKKVRTSRLGRTKYIRSFMPSFPLINPDPGDVDVLLQYDASLGVPTKVPTVTVFHDLIPYLFRDQEIQKKASGLRLVKNSLARELYWKKYLRSLENYKNSAKTIAISEASRQDLLDFFPSLSKDAVDVVYHGVDESFVSATRPSKKMEQLATKPFLLYVGGIDLRKNIVALIPTLYELKKKHADLRLVAVGKEFGLDSQLADLGWQAALAKNEQYASDVITPGFVSDSDLAFLYQQAEAFVLPSRYEGFGMPVLEAMQAGCPVVSYANSSIPEVAGDAALLVEDGSSLVPAIEQLLDNKQLREQLIKKGKAQAKRFTWQNTAKQTLAVLREVGKTKA